MRALRRFHSWLRYRLWFYAVVIALAVSISWVSGASMGFAFAVVIFAFSVVVFALLILTGWLEWRQRKMVRPATEDDVAAIVAVFEGSFATLDFLPEIHTHDEHTAHFGRVVTDGEAFVHERDEQIDGFAAFSNDLLTHLYVAPDAWARGVGLALFHEATRRRLLGFTFWVFQQNARARGFYEHRGCKALRFTDGADNEERTPDVLYEWRP